MKNFIFFIAFIFTLGNSFGQSTLIEPNSNNGILSKNATTVISDPGVISPSLTGAGTRLMWIPAKSAFRVGSITGTQWDASNIGTWSFGSGYNNIASGAWSFAAGNVTTASNTYSTAMGNNTNASGVGATALGYLTTASGDVSTALGEGTTAKAYRSMAVGYYNDPIATSNLSLNISTDPLFIIGNGTSNNARSNALMILKNGNVGIGDDNPTYKLSVNSTTTGQLANFSINNASNNNIVLIASTQGTGPAGAFNINNALNSTSALFANTNGSGNGITATANLGTGGYFSSAGGYALITGSGNVGIGEFAPPDKLTVTTATNSLGITHTDGTISLSTYVGGAGVGGYFGTKSNHPLYFMTNNGAAQMTLTTAGKVGIGTTTVSANEILEVNGRMRLRRGTFASGLWLNNSANGTALADGAFIGLNNETAGSESAGFYLNGAFRWYVDRTGNTTQNSATVSNLAGIGTRSVSADANGTLTTAAQTYTISIPAQAFQPRFNNSGTFTSYGNYGNCFMTVGSSDDLVASVSLPDGATITGVTFYYIDNDATAKFICDLERIGLSSTTSITSIFIGTTATISQSNTSVISFNLPINPNGVYTLVDNTTYSYSLLVSTALASGGSTPWSANMSVKGVKITYTL